MDESTLAGKTCLVTGGAGFIGSHIVRRLVRLGCTVRVLDNLSTGNLDNLNDVQDKIEFVKGDAAKLATVREVVCNCDYIFHLAAMASVPQSMANPDLCHASTATSTINLLREAANGGTTRLILASTSAAYGNSAFVAKRESDPTAPLSPYAAAKLASEAYCQAFYQGFGLETVVLRYFNVFGPSQDPQSEYSAVIPKFVSMILSGERPIIYGDGHQSRDFVYVENVVDANMLAATVPNAAGGVFNVACGIRTTLLELLDLLRNVLGQGIEPIHEPPRAGDVVHSMADISQAIHVLGYSPKISIAEGLEKSVDYYRGLVGSN